MDKKQLVQVGVLGSGFTILITLIVLASFHVDFLPHLVGDYIKFVDSNQITDFLLDPFFMLLFLGIISSLGLWWMRSYRYSLRDIAFDHDAVLFRRNQRTAGLGTFVLSNTTTQNMEFLRGIIETGLGSNTQFKNLTTLSVEIPLGSHQKEIRVNLFTEAKGALEIKERIEKEISAIICLYRETFPNIDLERLRGGKLKKHFFKILGSEIHDYDVDRSELLLLGTNEGKYVSVSYIKRPICSLSDFEYFIGSLTSIQSEEEFTLVFPMQIRTRKKIETSPYLVLQAKSRSDLHRQRRVIISSLSKIASSNHPSPVHDIRGPSLVKMIGVILTRGILPMKYTFPIESVSLAVDIRDRTPQAIQTPQSVSRHLLHNRRTPTDVENSV